MRRSLGAAAAVLLLTACGRALAASPGASPPVGASPTATPSPTAAVGPAASAQPWQLVLSGGLSGTFQGTQAQQPCGALAGGFAVRLPFQYQGRAFLLDVAIPDYVGPGSYPAPPARVSVHSAGFGNGPPVFYSGVKGTVAIATGGTSGAIDEDLSGQGAAAHVTGSWHC